MKTQIKVNPSAETLTVSNAFYKQACIYGTKEFKALRSAVNETGYRVVVTTVQKKSYNGLNFARMEAYILSQPNSKANLNEFMAVKMIAKIKGSAYPLTKKWFLAKFPEYKLDEVSGNETKAIIEGSEKPSQTEKDNAVILPKIA